MDFSSEINAVETEAVEAETEDAEGEFILSE